MEINFKAHLIDTTQVMKRGRFCKKYEPQNVSFVKLDLDSKHDKKTLKKLKNLGQNLQSKGLRDMMHAGLFLGDIN